MAQEYKVKSSKKGKDATHGNFYVYLEFEDYPNQVSLLTNRLPNVGETLLGNITPTQVGDKTYYNFKKEQKDKQDKSELYKKQNEERALEQKKSDNSKLLSFCTSYACRMAIAGIVPFYQQKYTINDLTSEILDLMLSQDVDLRPLDRTPIFSYAIDIYEKYLNDQKDPLVTNKFKLPDAFDKIKEETDGVFKPVKVFTIYRSLIAQTKKLSEKLNN